VIECTGELSSSCGEGKQCRGKNKWKVDRGKWCRIVPGKFRIQGYVYQTKLRAEGVNEKGAHGQKKRSKKTGTFSTKKAYSTKIAAREKVTAGKDSGENGDWKVWATEKRHIWG